MKLVALVHVTEIVVDVLYVRVDPPATMFEANRSGEALTLEHEPALAVAGKITDAAANNDIIYVTP